jgi:methionyl-tRNA formyltransferase
MEPGAIDAGPIFARTYLPVTNNTYIADVYSWMHGVIPSLFVEAMIRLAEPGFSPIDQHALSARPLRCQPRRPEDGRIDWNCDARQIQRLVRASARPFAGAYAWVNGGRRVTVWRACLAELDHDILAVPGQIMGRGPNGGILVACGAGVIEIEEAEVEGGGALPSANRHRLTSMPDIAARP